MGLKISMTALMAGALSLGACGKTVTSTPSPIAETLTAITHADDTYTVSQSLTDFTDYILIKTNGGENPQVVSLKDALDDLAAYDAVFVGESHGHIANHRLQTNVFSGIYERHNNVALSMEQFERDAQSVLDEYLAGEIGEGVLTKDDTGWSHYKQSYRPMVEFAKKNKLSVIAANAPAMAVRCVGMNGPEFLDTVKGENRELVAATLNLQDGPYKDKFYGFMGAAPSHGPGASADEIKKAARMAKAFAGQVTRDDTMAESIYKHMQANPGSKVVHTNGSFHSAALLGTVERLALRDSTLKLANIHPVELDDADSPSFTQEDLAQGQYLVLITAQPEQYIKEENLMAFYKRTGSKMKNRKCEF